MESRVVPRSDAMTTDGHNPTIDHIQTDPARSMPVV
jgi:hypothetical protein